MLYYFVRSMVRISLHLYCKRIGWEGEENIPKDKPILFAPTHSNSFFDALFIASAFHRSVYCLARGDAFRNPTINKLLRHFRILPIYRQSENEDNSTLKNNTTFQECKNLFHNNKWVLIHPEGFSSHQTHVLPLKKGFITIAQNAWAQNIDLYIIPVSITYNNFSKWGKKCDIIFSKPIKCTDLQADSTKIKQELNEKVYTQLSDNFPSPLQFKGKKLLWGWMGQLIYYAGWVVHFPIYFLSQYLGKRFTQGTVFHDSVVVGLLSQLLWVYYGVILGVYIFLF
jgi:1-acyl-sn-glycerol-3-phosphate acyltransferase